MFNGYVGGNGIRIILCCSFFFFFGMINVHVSVSCNVIIREQQVEKLKKDMNSRKTRHQKKTSKAGDTHWAVETTLLQSSFTGC